MVPPAIIDSESTVSIERNEKDDEKINNGQLQKHPLALWENFNCPEVTFCDVSDDDRNSIESFTVLKKRFTFSDGDYDSIASTSVAVEIGRKKKPLIPDGGYGWVVVAAAMVTSMISDGISFSFGLLLNKFIGYFGESEAKTAWIGSFFLAVPLIMGPIMSNLVDKYGCRKMTIAGGLLSALGFALSSFANSIEVLYITYGLIAGLGLGLVYVTAVVSIAFWFEKKRTFATGIGASGTGLGTFIYAPLTQWLIDTYGWRGTTLIIAGTLLNMCVCGCLMRDPDWLIEENRLESRSQSFQTFSNSSICLDEIKKMLETGATKETVLDTLVTNCNTETNQQISDKSSATGKRYTSEVLLPTYEKYNKLKEQRHGSQRSLRKKDCEITADEIRKPTKYFIPKSITDEQIHQKRYLASIETLNGSEKISIHDSFIDPSGEWPDMKHMSSSRYSLDETLMAKPSDSRINISHSFRGNSLDILHENDTYKENVLTLITSNDVMKQLTVPQVPRKGKESHGPLRNGSLRKNVPLRNSNYLRNMRIHRNSIHYRGAMLNTHRYRLRASSCPNIYRNSMTTLAKEEDKWYDNFVDIIKSVFDFSLFKNPKFCCINLSTLLLFIWFIVPFLYITPYMVKHGYKEEVPANLISIIGVCNMVGMIILGWLGDQPWVNVAKTYAFCLVVCGISICLMPLFVTNYTVLTIICVVFGLSFASSFSFTPIILVEMVDLDEFTCAYGLVLLVQGVGNLIGPPLAGLMFEIIGRWDDTFYASGFFIAVSGLLAYITGILIDREMEREGSDKENSDVEKEISSI